MAKTIHVVSQVENPQELKKPKNGWKKTMQLLSNGQVRIIVSKVP